MMFGGKVISIPLCHSTFIYLPCLDFTATTTAQVTRLCPFSVNENGFGFHCKVSVCSTTRLKRNYQRDSNRKCSVFFYNPCLPFSVMSTFIPYPFFKVHYNYTIVVTIKKSALHTVTAEQHLSNHSVISTQNRKYLW